MHGGEQVEQGHELAGADVPLLLPDDFDGSSRLDKEDELHLFLDEGQSLPLLEAALGGGIDYLRELVVGEGREDGAVCGQLVDGLRLGGGLDLVCLPAHLVQDLALGLVLKLVDDPLLQGLVQLRLAVVQQLVGGHPRVHGPDDQWLGQLHLPHEALGLVQVHLQLLQDLLEEGLPDRQLVAYLPDLLESRDQPVAAVVDYEHVVQQPVVRDLLERAHRPHPVQEVDSPVAEAVTHQLPEVEPLPGRVHLDIAGPLHDLASGLAGVSVLELLPYNPLRLF
jgi:hypothetical protein